jgi:hypothetical protein
MLAFLYDAARMARQLGPRRHRRGKQVAKETGKRVVLYAAIGEPHHDALRFIAFKEKRSVADVTREAIERYLADKAREYPIGTIEAKPGELKRISLGKDFTKGT